MQHGNFERARLGIDIGRVIIGGFGHDTSFLNGDEATALRTPALPGAIDTIARFVRALSARVWLVSKAGPRIEHRTRNWLEQHRFFDRTGLAPDHVRFCRRRPDKAEHARELGLTHFIDDRLDVLVHLRGLVERLVLFGAHTAPAWAVAAPSWREVPAALGLPLTPTETREARVP